MFKSGPRQGPGPGWGQAQAQPQAWACGRDGGGSLYYQGLMSGSMDFGGGIVQSMPAGPGWGHYPGPNMGAFYTEPLPVLQAPFWGPELQRLARHPPGCKCGLHGTHISDIPEPILISIFTCVTDVRARNCMSLVCRDWYLLERLTRTSLTLRGNIVDLASLPMCFNQVTCLDLSLVSPWGYSIYLATSQGDRFARLILQAFPLVKEVTIYAKSVHDVQLVACLWPRVESVRLVRWHQRPMDPASALEAGSELVGLLSNCPKLNSLDLSKFYCWTEDVAPALSVEGSCASNLRSLNLLKISPEGFRSQELGTITQCCKNLEEFFVLCDFDPRFVDPVGDEALVSIGTTCTKLRVLHLVDTNAWDPSRGRVTDGIASEDANITRTGLQEMFKALPHLEELVFLLAQNVRDAGPALETLQSHCKNLRVLRLSHFHGVCKGPEPDGLALCSQLVKLSIKDCADLVDKSLLAIAKGCARLQQLHLRSVGGISYDGLSDCVKRLAPTLRDVEITGCGQLNCAQVLQALEPIQPVIRTLSIDCIWDEEIVAREEAAAAGTSGLSGGLSVADILSMSAEDLFQDAMTKSSGHGRHPALTSRKSKSRNRSSEQSQGAGFFESVGEGTDFVAVGYHAPEPYPAPSRFHAPEPSHALGRGSYKSTGGLGCVDSDFVTVGFDAGEQDTDFVTMGFDAGDASDFVTIGFDPGEGGLQVPSKRPRRSLDDDDSFVVMGVPDICDSQPAYSASRTQGRGCFNAGGQHSAYLSSLSDGVPFSQFNHQPSGMNHAESWMQLQSGSMATSQFPVGKTPFNTMTGTGRGNLQPAATHPLIASDELSLGWKCNQYSTPQRPKPLPRSWSSLRSLSLWTAPWTLLKYLSAMGLSSCPVLEKINIRAEGEVKDLRKPPAKSWGLGSLARYTALSKLELDFTDAVGYALSAPQGCHDLSQWERFLLTDLRQLGLMALEYSPPVDKDLNHRGLSLPAVGLISECVTLRKLSVHGTVHEHFLFMLKQCTNLRDFQLLSDYYPAPQDTSTELRPLSFKRFEAALAERGFPD